MSVAALLWAMGSLATSLVFVAGFATGMFAALCSLWAHRNL